jgi:hypothetical protein
LRLAEQQRRAQLTLRAATLRDVLKLWPAFDLENINRTWPAIEDALVRLIQARGATSSGLAIAYYERERKLAGIGGRATPRVGKVLEDDIVTGLRAIGPANAALQLAKNRPVERVAAATLVNLSGEVTRQVMNHGRQSLSSSLIADARANGTKSGVRRVTGGNPCSWCADQASQIYPPTERFPAHMHCSCFPEASFRQ